ncbi:MAG: hypothetical protein NTZ78_09700 [Candidatus Aureabacteria bacterium]|nr:hypothetical protein [Candidatus Auribacterota bacterium]
MTGRIDASEAEGILEERSMAIVDVSERGFEQSIECGLLRHGQDTCGGEYLLPRIPARL